MLEETDAETLSSYEYRKKWDPYLMKALELIDENNRGLQE